jgi:PucR family transcriptional regulator, purine catabolism regulatory protein
MTSDDNYGTIRALMDTFANDRGNPVRRLPAAPRFGTTLADVLAARSLTGSSVLAGRDGLGRPVRSMNVMEVPDVLPWVRPGQLLLTTGFPLLRGAAVDIELVCRLIGELDDAGVAGLAIKLGRYVQQLPAEARAAADRRGFPIVGLPADLVFGDAMAEVLTSLLAEQSAALGHVDELHRALEGVVLGGGNLAQVTDELAGRLDAAVLVTTPDGRVLTSAGPVAQLLELPLFEAGGRFLVERVPDGISAPDSATPGRLAAAAVVAGGFEHGRIVAHATAESFAPYGDHLVDALERAAAMVALVMTRQIAVAAVESKYRGDYLRDALAGRAGGSRQVREHCAMLDWDVDRPHVVLVATLDPSEPSGPPRTLPLRSAQDRFAAAWEQVVHTRDKSTPVVGFSTEVVCLLPVDNDPETAVRSVVGGVAGDRGGGRRSFCTGVSRVVADPAEWPVAYEQARKAVAIGRRVHGEGTVTHFDALGVHRLLSLVPDPAELQSFTAEVLGDLAADTAEMADLRLTLQTLLDTNLNVAETARLLHFHYNTLRYRISKLERLVGPFSTDAHLRLDVALALQVIQMKGL